MNANLRSIHPDDAKLILDAKRDLAMAMAELERLKAGRDEIARIARIDDCIFAIREGVLDAARVCDTAESVRLEIEYVEKRAITEEIFQEKIDEARAVHSEVLKTMRKILAEREERDKLRGFYDEIVKATGDDRVLDRLAKMKAQRDAANAKYDEVLSVLIGDHEDVDFENNEAARKVRDLMEKVKP